MTEDIQTRVKGMEFWPFLAKHLPAHYTWGTKVALNDLISFSKTLEEPLFQLPKSHHQLAITIFRCILRICGDEDDKPTFKQKERAKLVLLKLVLDKGPRLRDEIVLQLIKQIRGNPSKISSEAAWASLACVLSISGPSEHFIFPFMHWLIDVIELHQSKSFQEWARFCLARAYHKLSAIDRRAFVPEKNEITYVSNKKQVKVPLFMANGAFMTMFIESYTDFEQLKRAALARLGLHTTHLWRYGIIELVEYENKYEERFLENHFNVLDTIASWSLLKTKASQVKKCRLFFGITANMPCLETVDIVTKLQFLQYAANLHRGKIVMTNSEIGKLASIHFSADFQNIPEGELVEQLE